MMDHDDHGDGHHVGHESPPLMTVPLMILAGFALLAGLAFGPWTGTFEHHLARTAAFNTHGPEHGPDYASMALGSLAGLAGIALAWFFYARPNPIPARLEAMGNGQLYRWSRGKFFVDEFYDRVVVRPTRLLAAICRFLDEHLVHGIVELFAGIPRFVGQLSSSGPLQNGLVQYYAAATALGVVGLLLLMLLF